MKYNYVFMGFGNDYYLQAFSDLKSLDNVVYVTDDILKELRDTNFLYKLHFSRINRYINLPFKWIWNKYYFHKSFENDNPICFVMWGSWARLNPLVGYSNYLRRQYINCKIVWFLQDLVANEKDIIAGDPIAINDYTDFYDIVVSYDLNDCRKYNLVYHPTVMSYSDVQPESHIPESDILFVGRDKGRLQLAIDICKRLSSKELKCDFRILGVPKERQIPCNGITYIDQFIPYAEMIKLIKKTKCLVELLQDNAESSTLRTWEALLYDKYLITNNYFLLYTKFYKDSMSVIKTANDINEEFINCILNNDIINYNVRKEVSPISFVEFLEEKLKK